MQHFFDLSVHYYTTANSLLNYEEVLLIQIFLYIVDSSNVEYIHIVLPMKSGAKNENIRYYDMMIQTLEDIYRSALCCEDLSDQLLKIKKTDVL